MGGVVKNRSKRQNQVRFILWFFIIVNLIFFITHSVMAVPVEVVADAPSILDRIRDFIKEAKKELAAGAWQKGAQYLTQQVAYDLAVAAASGDVGQFPLFQEDEWKDYVTGLGDAAVGDLLDELVYKWTCEGEMTSARDEAYDEYKRTYYESQEGLTNQDAVNKEFGEFASLDDELTAGKCRPGMGVRLCEAAPRIRASLLMGIGVDIGDERKVAPRCSLSDIAKNFGPEADWLELNLGYDFGDLTPLVAYYANNAQIGTNGGKATTLHDVVTHELPNLFSDEESDLGQYMQVSMEAANMKAAAEEKAKQEQAKEWKCIRDMITGKCKTPSLLIGETQKQSIQKVFGEKNTFTGSLVADFIGTFTNTFMSQYIKNLMTKGLTSGGEGGTGEGVPQYAVGGVAAAKAKFAAFTKPAFGPSGVVNILSELATCPENPTVNNCALDQKWEQAIEKKMRLEDSINDGYIDATRPFAFGPDGQELDYNNGLPYRSIIILRKYGIVPVTWEIAARYIKDHGGGNITLQMLIDNFNNTESPYYGLVSKDWVLTMQENYCRRRGIGETISYESWEDSDGLEHTPQTRLVQRSAECVDDQTCIQEEEDGSCQAYGYCTKQKAIWRFQGTQCSEEYASCEKFTSSTGTSVSYLKNNLDYSGCNADNAGCGWYCKNFNEDENSWSCFYAEQARCAGGSNDGLDCASDEDCPGQGVCTNYRDYDEASFPGGLSTDKIAYLDGETETCDTSSVGCDEFMRTDANLIANGSFEYLEDGFLPDDFVVDEFNGWTKNGVVSVEQHSADTYGITPHSGDYAAYFDSSPVANFDFSLDTGHSLANRTFTLSLYGRYHTVATSIEAEIVGDGENKLEVFNYTTANWERNTLSYTFGPLVTESVITVRLYFPSAATVILDSLQLEEADAATDYQDYIEGDHLYLNGERLSCSADEVGCTLYTSVSSGAEIPAKYVDDSHLDDPVYTCPADMVGCQAVEEVALEPTNNVPCWDGCENDWMTGKRCYNDQSKSCSTNADCGGNPCLPIVSLIPATGNECSAAYNGCQEYTNLDVVAEGGEGLEYYTYVRQCVPPDHPDVGKYYTWVGSDTEGYQLVEWNLVKSNESSAPCQNLSNGDDPYSLSCQDLGETNCTFGDDPDCREYFDENLDVYYRLESKTIRATADCHPLRNTYDDKTYYGQPSLSYTCPQAMNGCREYRGSNGNNIREAIMDDFEDGTNQDWVNLENNDNSIFIGGHSGMTKAATIQKDVSSYLTQERTYLLSFWAKAEHGSALAPTIGFSDNPGVGWLGTLFAEAGTEYPGAMTVPDGANWYYFTLGPVTVTWDPKTTPTYLVMEDIAYFGMEEFETYFEQITLTETTDLFYLIKDSATLCQGNENCEEYIDLNNQHHYIKNFTNLCPEDKVGCEALLATQNTTYPYSETFGEGNSQIVVPDDALARVVVDEDKECSSADRGCREVGLPILDYILAESNSVQTITEYETFYLKDDADKYDTIWCNQSELGCEKYTSQDNSYYYFKNPQDRTCLYTQPPGKDAKNWYKWGYDELSDYNLGLCPINTTFNQPQAEADSPNNWVGICDDSAVGCTAYRDPKDPQEINNDTRTITKACEPECPLVKDNLGHDAELLLEGVCSFGANQGNSCASDEDCPDGKCIDKCSSKVCTAGNVGEHCQEDSDCGVDGICSYRDTGNSGCQSYYYLRDTVDSSVCYDVVNEEEGCKLFNNTDSDGLNYSTEMSADGYSPLYGGYCQEGFKDLNGISDSYNPCSTNDDCLGDCVSTGESGPPTSCLSKICDAASPSPGIACDEDADCAPGLCADTILTSGSYCDSNAVILVQPDRICDEWLGCKTALEVDDPDDMDNDGKIVEMACLELGTCQELGDVGQCLDFIEQEQQELMGGTSNLSEMQFTAGYVYPGFELGHCADTGETCTSDTDCPGSECLMIEGYFPYSAMTEVGLGGSSIVDLIDYGDFETGNTESLTCADGPDEYLGKPCISGDDCGGKNAVPEGVCNNPRSLQIYHKDHSTQVSIIEDDSNDKIDSNNILQFTSNSTNDYLLLGIGQNELSDGEEYVLSFDGAFNSPPLNPGEEIVDIDFLQAGLCSKSLNACLPDTTHDCSGICETTGFCSNIPSEPCDEDLDCAATCSDCQGTGTCTGGFCSNMSSRACIIDDDCTDSCADYLVSNIGQASMSTTFTEYILDPTPVSTPLTNAATYIRFQPATDSLGLILDNVSLKPVLAVGQSEEAEVFASSWVNNSTYTNVDSQTFGHPREDKMLGQGENCDQGWCMGTDSLDPGPHSCSNLGDNSPDCADAPGYPDCDIASWCALSLGDSSNMDPGPTTEDTFKITVEMAVMVSDQEGTCDVDAGGTGCDLWVDENGTASDDKFRVYVSPTLDIGKFQYLGEAAGNQVGYFDINGSGYAEIRYVMIVDNSSGGGSNNAGVDIDSVTSLNIPYDLVSRSCRAYPKEDSLACHYFNYNGMEYNGWQGYCIDRDPANPNRCITWYPVDVIAGESLAFGVIESSGYASSGERSPLYVCLDMGLYEYRTTRTNAGCYCDPEGHDCPAGYEEKESSTHCDDCDCCWPIADRHWRECAPVDCTGWCTYLDGQNEFQGGSQKDIINEDVYPEPSETVAARCDVIAKVVDTDGSNTVWSGRIQKDAYNIINVGWSQDQDLSPYGSINALTGEPDTWDTDMYCAQSGNEKQERRESCDGNEPLYWSCDPSESSCTAGNIARAGSPYSCHSDDPGCCSTTNAIGWFNFFLCFGLNNTECNKVDGCSWHTAGDECVGIPKTAECSSITSEGDCTGPFCLWNASYLECSPVSICGEITTDENDCETIPNCKWDIAWSPKCQSKCNTYLTEPTCTPQLGCEWSDDALQCMGVMPKQCADYDSSQCGILEDISLGCSYASGNFCTNITSCSVQTTSDGCGIVSDKESTFDCVWEGMTCDNDALNLTGLPYTEASNNYEDGVWRARRLYADVFDVWVWDSNSQQYSTSSSYSFLDPDTQKTVTVSASEIKELYSDTEGFAGIGKCNDTGIGPRPAYPGDYCYIFPIVFNLKVNDGEGVKYIGSDGNAMITFNTSVDAEQLPLDRFVVDWGDGSEARTVSWGGAPKSDGKYPHVVSKVYGCDDSNETYYEADCKDWGYPLSEGGGCCAYIPTITAYDNWGFEDQAVYNGKIIVTP